jgi:MurNAc alpha-1-phosphate uridylyltransferase
MSIARVTHGMVLAAGLGLRMRPITEKMPKALVPVAGRTLIDRAIDRLEDAGVTTVVVNLHHLGDMVERHLKQRPTPTIVFSREPERLETGGGVAKVLPQLGRDPFFVTNSDVLWLNGPSCALKRMMERWDDSAMDGLLLLHRTVDAYGYTGDGDFLVDPIGRPKRRPEREIAPYLFTGVQILHPRLFKGASEGAYSLNVLYDRAIERARLCAIVHDGEWFHIGTPEGLAEADAFLRARFSGKPRR